MRSFYNQWQRSWLILCSERGPNMLLAKCLQQMTLGIVHSGSGFQHERTISVGYLWADVLLYSWVKSLISTAWSSSYLCMMGKCLMEFWSMYNCKSECCFYLVDYLVDKIIILWGLQQCLLSPATCAARGSWHHSRNKVQVWMPSSHTIGGSHHDSWLWFSDKKMLQDLPQISHINQIESHFIRG